MHSEELEKIGGPLAQTKPELLIEQRALVLHQIRKDLLWLHQKSDTTIELEDINDLMRFNESYTHKHKLIITIGDRVNITKEAREANESLRPFLEKKAIITRQLPHRIIVNFMLARRPSKHPTKVFPNVTAGLNWLEN